MCKTTNASQHCQCDPFSGLYWRYPPPPPPPTIGALWAYRFLERHPEYSFWKQKVAKQAAIAVAKEERAQAKKAEQVAKQAAKQAAKAMVAEERAWAKEAKVARGKATMAGVAIATMIHQHHNAPDNMTSYYPIDEVV